MCENSSSSKVLYQYKTSLIPFFLTSILPTPLHHYSNSLLPSSLKSSLMPPRVVVRTSTSRSIRPAPCRRKGRLATIRYLPLPVLTVLRMKTSKMIRISQYLRNLKKGWKQKFIISEETSLVMRFIKEELTFLGR